MNYSIVIGLFEKKINRGQEKNLRDFKDHTYRRIR